MHKEWLAVAVLVALCTVGVVKAAGLGELRVQSRLGQPFVAEVELINVSKETLGSLNAILAPTTAYEATNLKFDPVLNSLSVSVQLRTDGTPFVRVTSWRPVAEPYLNLLIELNWNGGSLRRLYAALLDLPTTATVASAPAAVAKAVLPAPAPMAAGSKDGPVAARAANNRVNTPAARATPVAPVAPALPVVAQVGANATQSAAPATNLAATSGLKPVPAKAETPVPDSAKSDRVETVKSDTPKIETAVAEAGKAEPTAPTTPASTATPVADKEVVETAPAQTRSASPSTQSGIAQGLMKYLLWIVGGVLLLLAAIAGLWWRGRQRPDANVAAQSIEPTVDGKAQWAPATTAAIPAAAAVAVAPGVASEITVANVTDLVDPVDEAKVYINYGQFEQAEQVLRDAIVKEPRREDLKISLLELLAKRGDKDGFNQLAARLRSQTGGAGEHWKRAAVLGYAMDPTHPLYPPPADATTSLHFSQAALQPREREIDISFDTGEIGVGSDDAKRRALNEAGLDPVETTVAPWPAFDIELPNDNLPGGTGLDIRLDIPGSGAESAHEAAVTTNTKDAGLDFKLELPEVDGKTGTTPAATVAGGAGGGIPDQYAASEPQLANNPWETAQAGDAPKGEIWREVQQKFDLIRAYLEMGDKEGAREVLNEIENEGDPAQKAEARKIAQTLE